MSNTISPFGFRPIGHRDGSQPTQGQERKFIASSDTNLYFTGDPVALSTTGPYVTVPSAATGQIYGIFVGCEYYNPAAGIQRTVWSPYFPGSVQTSSGTADALAYVISDPDMMFLVQTSSAGAITSSQIGQNIGYNGNSSQGATTTGISNISLLDTGSSTGSSMPFTIVDLYSNWAPPAPGLVNGTDNTTGGNYVIVAANNWNRNSGTTGA